MPLVNWPNRMVSTQHLHKVTVTGHGQASLLAALLIYEVKSFSFNVLSEVEYEFGVSFADVAALDKSVQFVREKYKS